MTASPAGRTAHVVGLLLVFVACAPSARPRDEAPLWPRTRAERTAYRETSSHADVMTFLDSVRLASSAPLGSVGSTNEGRAIPYLIASRPRIDSPDAARRSGKPIVYVQGNIHGGEIEGKEALQALVRDLLADARPNVLDSIVLIAVPIYNADGNDRFGPQARNRGSQNGPEVVGQRPNAQQLDLNRDYMKVDASETRASLAMLAAWDPHVFVDLHTTNGSYHGYALTWAPALNPAGELAGATFGAAYARDSLLPELQRRVKARHDVATFPYGNFDQRGGPDAVPQAWITYDHRPRFGTNYFALRGRIGILSEAYSHDPFPRRVQATYAFTRELLSLVAERGAAIMALARNADAAMPRIAGVPLQVPVRARLWSRPRQDPVTYEVLQRTGDSTQLEPGVPRGLRRTGQFVTATMPVVDRFEPVRSRPAPWGYALSPADTAAIRVLAAHGILMYRTRLPWSGDAGEQFTVDSTLVAPRPFQNRREVRLEGRWSPRPFVVLAAGAILVPTAQPLGVLAMYLLEPESDDGLVAWDIGGRASPSPLTTILRVDRDLRIPMERVDLGAR